MRSSRPMSRLLQGDVGSGKTIVAAQAAVIAVENGYQVALMAPTEILAEQHYIYMKRLFEPLGYAIDLLKGSLPPADLVWSHVAGSPGDEPWTITSLPSGEYLRALSRKL